MKVGIVGMGRMGAAIASRLLSLGHEVAVWNRTPQKAQALAVVGGKVASTPAEPAVQSEAVITILSNAEAIEQTYHGPRGCWRETSRGSYSSK